MFPRYEPIWQYLYFVVSFLVAFLKLLWVVTCDWFFDKWSSGYRSAQKWNTWLGKLQQKLQKTQIFDKNHLKLTKQANQYSDLQFSVIKKCVWLKNRSKNGPFSYFLQIFRTNFGVCIKLQRFQCDISNEIAGIYIIKELGVL